MHEMPTTDKFLWDLQGYLVVRGVLSREEVAELNAAVDAKRHLAVPDGARGIGDSTTLTGTRAREILGGALEWEHPWCDPFRRLLADARLRPHYNSILGPGWRLDHDVACFIANQGAEGLRLHGAARQTFGPAFYAYNNGRMWSGMISVEYALTPAAEGDGGFCVIPGSHKANLPVPGDVLTWEAHRDVVRKVPVDAGDVVIFSEAVVHGTLPWTAGHERRALLYRYSPCWLHWTGDHWPAERPAWVEELDEAGRAVMEPPYVYDRPTIAGDGSVVVQRR
jgi:hypothetical protein